MMSCRCDHKDLHDCKRDHYGACDRRRHAECGGSRQPVCHQRDLRKPPDCCVPIYNCTPSVRPENGASGFCSPEIFSFYSTKFCRTINVRVWRMSEHSSWYSIRPHKFACDEEATICYHPVDPDRFPGRFERVKPIPCRHARYCVPVCCQHPTECECEALNIPGHFECEPRCDIIGFPKPQKRCRGKKRKYAVPAKPCPHPAHGNDCGCHNEAAYPCDYFSYGSDCDIFNEPCNESWGNLPNCNYQPPTPKPEPPTVG